MSRVQTPHTPRNVNRSKYDANLRVPDHLTQLLRKSIYSNAEERLQDWDLSVLQMEAQEDPLQWLISQLDQNFIDNGTFKAAYLQLCAFSKFVDENTDPSEVRRNRAISKWLSTERDNESTNVRLLLLHEEYQILPRVSWSEFRRTVQEFVSDIIGETVPLDALIGSFSGGASTSKTRTEGHPAWKYIGKADVTAAAKPWFDVALEAMHGWRQFIDQVTVRTVPGNELFTVPKTTTIDRCAAKEPDLNMFLQKGIGLYIRKSLRKVGINLNDQKVNQRLAREGSRHKLLATIDLSSASDSISSEVVFQFLPPLWTVLINDLRSPVTIIDGEEHVNEMFSSMGNGFTFELESLLFYAIARAVAYHMSIPGVISVYGDDIICPNELTPWLESVFRTLGFTINSGKSFWTGSFRESCGGHFLNGEDVTPFYVKEPIRNLADVILICNKIRKYAAWKPWGSNETGISWYYSPELELLWKELAEFVPTHFWGGRNLNSRYQLVSPGLPSKKLEPFKTKEVDLGTGGYIHWLNSTDGRHFVHGGIITSILRETAVRCRVRSVPHKRSILFDGPYFKSEMLEEG